MALDRDQVGLLFKLDADSKPATEEFRAFQALIGDLVEQTKQQSKEIADLQERIGKLSEEGSKKHSEAVKKDNKVISESFRSLSSEIIENFGVDGDVANELASTLKLSTLAIVGLTGAAAGLVAGLFALAKSVSDVENDLSDLSDETGIGVEKLSALKVAAEQNGASFEQLRSAVLKLQDQSFQARTGNEKAAKTFKDLGINIRDGAEPALESIVRRFNELKDPAEKAALLTAAFGDAGNDLIKTFDSLNGDLTTYTAKLRELGLTVTPENIAAAKDFDDQLKGLNAQFQSLKLSIGNVVIPAFTSLLTVIRLVLKDLRDLRDFKFQGSIFESFIVDMLRGGVTGVPAATLGNIARRGNEGLLPEGEKPPGGKGLPGNLNAGGAKKKAEDDTEGSLQQIEAFVADFERRRKALEEGIDKNAQGSFERLEKAEKEHQARLEQIRKIGAENLINDAKAAAEAGRITQEQAAQAIAEIEITAFAEREDRLKEQLDKVRALIESTNVVIQDFGLNPERLRIQNEALADERSLVDQLRILQEQRTGIEAEANAKVEEGRRKDAEALKRYVKELTDEAEKIRALKDQLERNDPLSARSIVGDAFANALNETGNIATAIKASITSTINSLGTLKASLEDITAGAINNFTRGLGSIVENYVLMGETGPAAIRKLLASTLAALAAEAAVSALVELAKGFAALFINPPEAAAHFQAAAIFGAAAAAAGIAGRAIAPSSGAGAGGGGGSSQSGAGGRGDRAINQNTPLAPQFQVIRVQLRAEQAPGVVVSLVRDAITDNGPLRETIQGEVQRVVGGT